MTMKFRVGDVVRVVRDGGYMTLKDGSVHTVKGVNRHGGIDVDLGFPNWSPARFELVEAAPVVGVSRFDAKEAAMGLNYGASPEQVRERMLANSPVQGTGQTLGQLQAKYPPNGSNETVTWKIEWGKFSTPTPPSCCAVLRGNFGRTVDICRAHKVDVERYARLTPMGLENDFRDGYYHELRCQTCTTGED
jgi:hypothetical protein